MFNHKQLYKKINHKFNEGKDINNITYHNEKGKNFGEKINHVQL